MGINYLRISLIFHKTVLVLSFRRTRLVVQCSKCFFGLLGQNWVHWQNVGKKIFRMKCLSKQTFFFEILLKNQKNVTIFIGNQYKKFQKNRKSIIFVWFFIFSQNVYIYFSMTIFKKIFKKTISKKVRVFLDKHFIIKKLLFSQHFVSEPNFVPGVQKNNLEHCAMSRERRKLSTKNVLWKIRDIASHLRSANEIHSLAKIWNLVTAFYYFLQRFRASAFGSRHLLGQRQMLIRTSLTETKLYFFSHMPSSPYLSKSVRRWTTNGWSCLGRCPHSAGFKTYTYLEDRGKRVALQSI